MDRHHNGTRNRDRDRDREREKDEDIEKKTHGMKHIHTGTDRRADRYNGSDMQSQGRSDRETARHRDTER